ncbi:MAG: hypothetical protein WA102_00115 [Candidatus Methanoperedens sp.]
MSHQIQIGDLPRIAPVVVMIVSLFSLSLIVYDKIYNVPDLTYEKGNFQLLNDEFLWWMVIKNEGNAPAELVEINIKIKNGNVTDSNVIITKNRIDKEITEYELFNEPYRKLSRPSSSSLEILIPYISSGIKYTINFNIKSEYNEDIVLITCKNCKYEPNPYKNRSMSTYFFISGLISVILLTFGYYYYKYFKKR